MPQEGPCPTLAPIQPLYRPACQENDRAPSSSASSTAGASARPATTTRSQLAQTPELGRLHARLPARADRRLRAPCRPARRPDGQFRGRPHEHRRRPGGDAGPAAHRRRRSPRASSAPTRRCTSFIGKLKASGGGCHLMGLLSPGGVHSHQDHMPALARILDAAGVPVAIHAFLDGRDTPPTSARRLRRGLRRAHRRPRGAADRHRRRPLLRDGPRQALGAGRAGLCALIVDGAGEPRRMPRRDRRGLCRGETDEFVLPTVIGRLSRHEGRRRPADGQFPRRPRAPDPDRAARSGVRRLRPRRAWSLRRAPLGMTRIFRARSNPFMPALFPAERLSQTLGEVVAEAG